LPQKKKIGVAGRESIYVLKFTTINLLIYSRDLVALALVASIALVTPIAPITPISPIDPIDPNISLMVRALSFTASLTLTTTITVITFFLILYELLPRIRSQLSQLVGFVVFHFIPSALNALNQEQKISPVLFNANVIYSQPLYYLSSLHRSSRGRADLSLRSVN
jgi:hypothetical protein